jgi:NDP-sugar pyrophosphorylase family protein
MKINEAVILAGGLGTRLRSVVSGIPKPMAPIKSKPFLEYLINYWSSQGITHFVFSTGYLSETIESYFKNHWGKSTISYSREKSPLGTGGALAQAIRQIQSDNTLVLNGDTYCEVPLAELEAAHHHQKSDITLVMSNGVHAGVALVKNNLFNGMASFSPPFSLDNDLVTYWKNEGKKVTSFSFEPEFIDIGTPSGYSLFIDSIGLRDTLEK